MRNKAEGIRSKRQNKKEKNRDEKALENGEEEKKVFFRIAK